jgi:hypothetical protein
MTYMEKIIDKVINNSVAGSCLYSHKGSTWLIFPEKKEWIISSFNENGYLWYNHKFFSNLFRYLDLGLGDDNVYIRNWVENNLGLKVGEHCHPDYLPNDYDWEKEFNVEEVITKGIKL